jgi:hypothetical protein
VALKVMLIKANRSFEQETYNVSRLSTLGFDDEDSPSRCGRGLSASIAVLNQGVEAGI